MASNFVLQTNSVRCDVGDIVLMYDQILITKIKRNVHYSEERINI